MRTTVSRLLVEDVEAHVVRKDVKHVRISVHPPDGAVRVSAPRHADDAALLHILGSRLPWIRRKRDEIVARERLPKPAFVTGERHFFGGQPYRLLVTEGRTIGARLLGDTLELCVRAGADERDRSMVLDRWYRERLVERTAPLLAEWEPRLGVNAAEVRVRRMKMRWGSCNPSARRVWLSLELAKHPERCLEYVLVHELVHLLEPSHGPRFHALMDQHMPGWRQRREALKAAP